MIDVKIILAETPDVVVGPRVPSQTGGSSPHISPVLRSKVVQAGREDLLGDSGIPDKNYM